MAKSSNKAKIRNKNKRLDGKTRKRRAELKKIRAILCGKNVEQSLVETLLLHAAVVLNSKDIDAVSLVRDHLAEGTRCYTSSGGSDYVSFWLVHQGIRYKDTNMERMTKDQARTAGYLPCQS
ncbi:hypothetical protein [Methylobacterium sp. ARG-1]|uniref:hypothetical protein n=1 Tax=Methylobacterium sp. ARG-1 TaxID=1692501 RepID=UPI00118767B3|nr:hypothetical protein [Methylobacterium sp. ARG-1]